MTTETLAEEREELLGMLAEQRAMLRWAVREIDETQARKRTTVSTLTLGGLVKHVTLVEAHWMGFAVERYDRAAEPPAPIDFTAPEQQEQYYLRDDESLAALLDEYATLARRTEEYVRGLPDLDRRYRLYDAPWDPPGKTWSVRQLLLWVLRETAQHCGHADIIRESLDGAKSMSF